MLRVFLSFFFGGGGGGHAFFCSRSVSFSVPFFLIALTLLLLFLWPLSCFFSNKNKTKQQQKQHQKKNTRKINAAKAAASASARREHMQAFVDKFRFNAKRASLVQSRIKAIERIDNGEDNGEDANDAGCSDDDSDGDDEEGSMTFRFPDPGAVPSPIVSFRDAAFRYSKEDPWLLRGLDFSIDAGSRVALVGANGAG